MSNQIDVRDAVAFNERESVVGRFTAEEVALLVAYFQGARGLLVDGKFGQQSGEELLEWSREGEEPLPLAAAPAITPLGQAIAAVAIEELGNGEESWNNSGPAIARYRELPEAMGKVRLYGEWCAYLQRYCVVEAHRRLHRLADCKWTWFPDGGRMKPRGGAKDMVEQAAASRFGEWVYFQGKWRSRPQVGDLVAYHRGRAGARTGHALLVVETFQDYSVVCIDGNAGGAFDPKTGKLIRPAYVRRVHVDLDLAPLYGIARLH